MTAKGRIAVVTPFLDKRQEVVIKNVAFLIGQGFKPDKNVDQLLFVELVAQMLQTVFQSMASAAGGQQQRRFLDPHIFGVHDLIGFPILQNPVLMNA